MKKINFLSAFCLFFSLVSSNAEVGAFLTPLTRALLDPSATAEWVDGQSKSREDFLDAGSKPHFPNPLGWVVAMPPAKMGWGQIAFGAEGTPGLRHLRIGFMESVPVGTIITRGKLTGVSVLKPTASYPGDLGDESQWIPAKWKFGKELSVWSIPPGTTSRALRFTYDCPPDEQKRAGGLSGVYVMSGSYENLAGSALPFTARNQRAASLLNDGDYGKGAGWSSGDNDQRPVISAENPETVSLLWERPLELQGVCLVFPVFGKVEVQAYTGPAEKHPREGLDADWTTVASGTCAHRSPESLNLNWFDFGRTVTTRALRLRILASTEEGNYLKGATKGGKACGLQEFMAFGPANQAGAYKSALDEKAGEEKHLIPVSFSIPEEAYVTLVIEDAAGKRIRNLVGDTLFAAGNHTVYWDGLDESGKIQGPYAGIYKMVGYPVGPGTYTVRGLTHKNLDLSYEFSVYSPGSTPWLTGSHWGGGTGGWLADHTPPAAVLALPGSEPRMLLTSPVAESSHGVIWTDLEGNKLDGKLWVGGDWSGATHLARDGGTQAVPEVYAYSGIVWKDDLRLVAFQPNRKFRIVAPCKLPGKEAGELGGLAAFDGLIAASLPKMNAIYFIDAAEGKVLGSAAVPDVRGLAFDAEGRLLALSGQKLLRYPKITRQSLASDKGKAPDAAITLTDPEVIVDKGLEDPQGLTLDGEGRLYVSDWGKSHQVKVFSSKGEQQQVIGAPGGARLGLYDPNRMDHPKGLAIAPNGRLWVAENSHAPKRVSVWSQDGKLAKAFYGPPQYGGGGTVDYKDPSRFYYAEARRPPNAAGLEFALDWKTGTSQLHSIYFLNREDAVTLPGGSAPQTPIYVEGRQYMTDVNNKAPIGGPRNAGIWLMVDGAAKPVASLGQAVDWPILAEERFQERWPAGLNPQKREWKSLSYAWSDLNGDGQISPDEVSFAANKIGSLTVNEKLEFCTAAAEVFAPEKFTDQGVPVYNLAAPRKELENFFMAEVGSGSGQITAARDGWTVGTGGQVRGIRNGQIVWTYPNEWPGQQAGVFSTRPTHRGELMATTRHMGTIIPTGSDAGEILAVDGDKGNVFLMTTDGLFVATLFHDVRLCADGWTMPKAERGMLLNNITLYDEEFWTTCTQTPDGKVYLVAGKSHCSIVRVDNLGSVKRMSPFKLEVTAEALQKAEGYRMAREEKRLALVGRERLNVLLSDSAPTVDGTLDDWKDAEWVAIEESANKRLQDAAGGKVEAAVRVAGDRLFVAYRTKESNLLANEGDAWQVLFKTGGALDLMLATNPEASPKRTQAEAGDLRLLVTLMKGKPMAVLYQPVAGEPKTPGSFSSPWRTITFDRVLDLSSQLNFAAKDGLFEYSIPLAALGLTPKDGLALRGDIGILRGNGFQTLQRIYWQNKATSTVADVPTEATLTPHLWGNWQFDSQKAAASNSKSDGEIKK
jgi:hypothetical protein